MRISHLLLTPSRQLQLLQFEPEKRLPLSDVSNHPWIVKYRSKSTSRGGSV